MDVQPVQRRHGVGLLTREPFPPILVPSIKSRNAAARHRVTPAWEIHYMQHKPPVPRQRLVDANFVAVEAAQRRPTPPAPHFGEVPLDFLRHQFSVGLPLGSPFTHILAEDKKRTVLDYRNMPLGILGTGGSGYVPTSVNQYEVKRRLEAKDELIKTMHFTGSPSGERKSLDG